MERIYYPSMQRVILFIYAAPVVVCGIGFVITTTIQLIRGEEIHFNWVLFTSLIVAWIGLRCVKRWLARRKTCHQDNVYCNFRTDCGGKGRAHPV